jgi:hypothetical protein
MVDGIVDVPMWAADGVVFIDDVPAKFFDAPSHALLNLRSSVGNADIPGTVGKMIANHRSVLPCPVDDLSECRDRLAPGSNGVCFDPLVHLCDMARWTVGVKKLGPVLAPALRHEFGLSFYCAPASGDSNSRVRKLLFDPSNHCIDGTAWRNGRSIF